MQVVTVSLLTNVLTPASHHSLMVENTSNQELTGLAGTVQQGNPFGKSNLEPVDSLGVLFGVLFLTGLGMSLRNQFRSHSRAN